MPRLQELRKVPVRLLCGALVMILSAGLSGCSDTSGVLGPEECTVELASGCWTFLGPEGEWITEVRPTPWGLFIGTRDGIFRLESDGNWISVGPGEWHGRLISRALLYLPTDPPRLLAGLDFRDDSRDTTRAAVYASFDGGRTWVPHDGGLSERSKFPYRVFVQDLEAHPADAQRVFMGTRHGVLRSLDAGETWEFAIGDFDDLSRGHVDILIDPDRPERLWVGGQGLIFNPFVLFSNDSGATWDGDVPTCNGTVFETPVYELALDPNRPGRLWAGTDVAIRWSDQAGAPGSWECGPGPRGAVVDLMVLGGALYAATVFLEVEVLPDGTVQERSHLGLYRTANGGDNWDSLAVPEGVPGVTEGAVDTQAERLLIGTRTGLWALRP